SNFQFDSWASFNENCGLSTENFEENEIIMYPNPANEFVKLDNLPQNSWVKISDFSGKIMYNRFATNQVTIIIINLIPGIYIVQIESHGKTVRKKLVVKN